MTALIISLAVSVVALGVALGFLSSYINRYEEAVDRREKVRAQLFEALDDGYNHELYSLRLERELYRVMKTHTAMDSFHEFCTSIRKAMKP